jgi:hypothetical protein
MVFGKVWAPLCTCSAAASVGDISWVLGAHKGVELGWWQTETPLQFADVSPPFWDATQPSSGTVVIRGVTNSFDGILWSGDYLVLTNKSIAVMDWATVYAPTGFSGGISIAPGARLNLYVGTGLVLTGVGTNAQADFAKNLVVFCLPSVTNVSLHGTFTGIIYAPAAEAALSGFVEIFGSITAKTVRTIGNCYVHYDEQISPPARPALASPRFVNGVGIQFEVSGSVGLTYIVQTSTNLTDWIPSSTNAAPFTYTDPDASLFPNRFYRVFGAR